jgi:hypothetical protein
MAASASVGACGWRGVPRIQRRHGSCAPQTEGFVKADSATVATGDRTSKVVGGTAVNGGNETVGTSDDPGESGFSVGGS